MPGVRKRGEEIREFIVANIFENKNIASLTAERFGISLPAVYKHFDRLVSEQQIIKKTGRFVLQTKQYEYIYQNENSLKEDIVWERDIKKHFAAVPQNVWQIWTYGFLEIFNNAVEHSCGKKIRVFINENRVCIGMTIIDDGIGIFKNITTKLKLTDEKDALLELAKGKRTTNRKRHSGQGIFFTSKIFDEFVIISDGITFNTNPKKNIKPQTKGRRFSTLVYMYLTHNSSKKIKDVFDNFSTEVPGDFDKTIIPVHLVNSSDLVSRSQARRLLAGLELFKEVILDFRDIEYIGQAFADEIFRVFVSMNPNTVIKTQNTNTEIQYMINRAINTKL